MKILMIDPGKLKQHPRNPRIHPESAVAKIAASIKQFGWIAPVLVNRENMILAGHARVKAALQEGITPVPVIKLDLSGPEADAYLVADNRLQEEGIWDEELLEELFLDFIRKGVDPSITGFDTQQIDLLLADADVQINAGETPLPEAEPEYDESIADDMVIITCEGCGYEFPV